jgi:hypothetical protein
MKLPTGLMMLVLGLAAPATVLAEDVYKSTMPDGSIVYGESPQPGAKKVERFAGPPTTTGTVVATPADKARADGLGARAPSVGVIPQAPREPAPTLQSGTINPPGVMPKRSY